MPQATQKRNCPNCYFSRPIAEALNCVKNPPAVDFDTGEARWPAVKRNDICGQFRFAEDRIDKDHWPKNGLPIYRDRFGDYCKIPLTQGKFAKVDPEDYIWLSQFRWFCQNSSYTSYAARNAYKNGKRTAIRMHNLIMATPPHLVCDHINANGLDNRKQNLRNCTRAQNNLNKRPQTNASSKFRGVFWRNQTRKWAAAIYLNRKRINLGCFNSEIQAAKAYDEAAKKYHGEFAGLNFESPHVVGADPAMSNP